MVTGWPKAGGLELYGSSGSSDALTRLTARQNGPGSRATFATIRSVETRCHVLLSRPGGSNCRQESVFYGNNSP